MTARVHSFVVTLEKDIRIDDAQAWIDSILLLKGVVSVTPLTIDPTVMMAQERARRELRTALADVLDTWQFRPN